jgi:hypothetical protein
MALFDAGGKLCGPFLWRADEQSGFNSYIRRMQCDHNPIMRRKRLDFRPPFGNPVCCFLQGRWSFTNPSAQLARKVTKPALLALLQTAGNDLAI